MRTRVRTFAAEGYPAAAAGTTIRITGQLKNEAEEPLGSSDLTTLTLTLVDTKDGSTLNSVEDEDVFNVGRGSVDSDGAVEIILEPDDTVLADDVARAVLGAILTWTYGGGKKGELQVDFKVQRLPGLT